MHAVADHLRWRAKRPSHRAQTAGIGTDDDLRAAVGAGGRQNASAGACRCRGAGRTHPGSIGSCGGAPAWRARGTREHSCADAGRERPGARPPAVGSTPRAHRVHSPTPDGDDDVDRLAHRPRERPSSAPSRIVSAPAAHAYSRVIWSGSRNRLRVGWEAVGASVGTTRRGRKPHEPHRALTQSTRPPVCSESARRRRLAVGGSAPSPRRATRHTPFRPQCRAPQSCPWAPGRKK